MVGAIVSDMNVLWEGDIKWRLGLPEELENLEQASQLSKSAQEQEMRGGMGKVFA